MVRRHHCRRCGKIVCNGCSTKRLLIPAQSSDPVRVCDPCFAEASSKRVSAAALGDSSADDDSDGEGVGAGGGNMGNNEPATFFS